MPAFRLLRPRLAAAVLAATLAACGGDAAEEAGDTLAAAEGDPTATAAPAPDAAASSDAPVTVDDIDRWQRGMAAELEAVRAAGARLAAARTGEDSVSALFDANDTATRDEGARGAGVDEERYGRINSAFSAVVRYMVPLSSEMDLAQMPAEMRKQMEDAHTQSLERESASLPADVVEALRGRAAELRRQEVELAAARMQAAGIGR